MGRVGNFLAVFVVTRILCGRGPAMFGLLFALLIPSGLLLVLIGALYPDGLPGFAEKAFRTTVQGFHSPPDVSGAATISHSGSVKHGKNPFR